MYTVMKYWVIYTRIFLDLYLSATALSANAHIHLFSLQSFQIRDLNYREINDAKLKFIKIVAKYSVAPCMETF